MEDQAAMDWQKRYESLAARVLELEAQLTTKTLAVAVLEAQKGQWVAEKRAMDMVIQSRLAAMDQEKSVIEAETIELREKLKASEG